MRAFIVVLLLSCTPDVIHGWTSLPSHQRNGIPAVKRMPLWSDGGRRTSSTLLSAIPPTIGDTSSLLLAQESWRQYVPLAVSAVVIVDILLGSPILNLIVAPMKRQAEDEQKEGGGAFVQPRVNPKERVDSEQVAQEALDRARNSLELRAFLDERKDPIEEAQKAVEKQMADLDETLEKKKTQE